MSSTFASRRPASRRRWFSAARLSHWRQRRQHQWRRRTRTGRRLRRRRPRARFRSSTTTVTSMPSPTSSSRAACLAALARNGTIYVPLALDVRADGRDGLLRSGEPHRDGLQSRRRGRRDGRQAGGHHQRRVASARRAADRLSGRRAGSGARDLRRHGRVRAVGSRPAFGRGAVRRSDAAADRGSAAAAGRKRSRRRLRRRRRRIR